MAHIYQPVMIKCLIENGGAAEDVTVARQLLNYDPSQLEYYQKVTNNMVGRVLTNHNVVKKNKKHYFLPSFSYFQEHEISELISICDSKIDEYIKKRGDAIWNHRRLIRNAISGTIRYEVLKRAEFRCELCGISAYEKALEVDHIIPVSKKGENAIENYQALCYSCNAMKRDRDSTDLREHNHQYQHRVEGCLFCDIDKTRIVSENHLAYLIYDAYPVTPLHCLIIPKRHTSDYFRTNQAERNAADLLIKAAKELVYTKDNEISGYNIGINCGEAAGQTIMHTHLHVIPRRKGDLENPVGGVRNVFPGKGSY